MKDVFLYMIEVSIISSVLYILYILVFEKRINFKFNRYYLLSIIIFSLIIPLLNIELPKNTIAVSNNLSFDLVFDMIPNSNFVTENTINQTFSVYKILIIVYWFVCLIIFSRFVYFIFTLFKLIKNNLVVKDQGYNFVYIEEQSNPFSFLNFLFLGKQNYKPNDLRQIIEHEKIHIKEYHSFDIILLEIYALFFWFNPFVFFLKNSIRTNHEYLADNGVIKIDGDSVSYQKLLLKEVYMNQSIGFVNNFKSLTIKKRIKMIHKNKLTQKKSNLLALLILPILIGLITIFGFSNNKIVILDHPENKKSIEKIGNPPKISPIKGIKKSMLTASFGKTFTNPFSKEKVMHKGIDIKAKEGTLIISPAAGIVNKVEEKNGYGKMIVIKHDEEYSTLFAHLSEFNVNEGDKIKQGDLIGYVGNTGQSTGPHLHYEVIKNGERVNPADYFNY